MRVDQTRTSQAGASQAGEASEAKKSGRAQLIEKGKKAQAEKSEASRSDAKAEISAKAKDFAKAKAVAADAPDVREDRVAELKKRISEGKYQVDAQAVADRMVDDHLSAQLD